MKSEEGSGVVVVPSGVWIGVSGRKGGRGWRDLILRDPWSWKTFLLSFFFPPFCLSFTLCLLTLALPRHHGSR